VVVKTSINKWEVVVNKFLSLLIIFLGSVSALEAQISSERIGVYGAGSFAGSDRVFVVNSDDIFQTEFRKGAKLGVRFSVDLTDEWAAEGSYSIGRNNLRVSKLDPPRRAVTFQTYLHQFTGNASYFFAPAGDEFRPFLTFGATLTRFSPTDQAQARAAIVFIDRSTRISSSTELGFNFGGGFEAAANQWLGIRIDARDHVMGIPRFGIPETPLSPGGVFYPVNGLLHNVEIAVGALFFLR
jgi:hypothetical protein